MDNTSLLIGQNRYSSQIKRKNSIMHKGWLECMYFANQLECVYQGVKPNGIYWVMFECMWNRTLELKLLSNLIQGSRRTIKRGAGYLAWTEEMIPEARAAGRDGNPVIRMQQSS